MGHCSHCGKKTRIRAVEIRFNGMILNPKVCKKCAKAIEKVETYATAFPKSKATPIPASVKKPKKEDKYGKYELSQEEIAATQRLRPTVAMEDSAQKREKDRIDSANKRVKLYELGEGKMAQARNERVFKRGRAMLGSPNIRVVSDNGFEVVLEAVNQ